MINYHSNYDNDNSSKYSKDEIKEDTSDEKMLKIQNQIDNVRGTMRDNIDKVLERGESLDLLIDKSDALNTLSFNFRNQARNLQRKLCRENFKRGCMIFCIVLFIIYVIIGSTCGFDFACVHHK
tara:strand:- start:176 stop:547 length:372 start_codon:yes stop_codon:yes gene_type:complete